MIFANISYLPKFASFPSCCASCVLISWKYLLKKITSVFMDKKSCFKIRLVLPSVGKTIQNILGQWKLKVSPSTDCCITNVNKSSNFLQPWQPPALIYYSVAHLLFAQNNYSWPSKTTTERKKSNSPSLLHTLLPSPPITRVFLMNSIAYILYSPFYTLSAHFTLATLMWPSLYFLGKFKIFLNKNSPLTM